MLTQTKVGYTPSEPVENNSLTNLVRITKYYYCDSLTNMGVVKRPGEIKQVDQVSIAE